jgi:hypothetical protein
MTHSKGHQVNVMKTLCAASRVELTIVTALSHAACQGSVENYRIEESMHPKNSHCQAFEPRQKHTQNTSINQHNCTKQGISQTTPRLCIQFAQHLLCQKNYRTSQPGWLLQNPLKHRAARGSPNHTQTQLPAAECCTHMPLPNTPTAVVPRMHPQASLS